MLVADIFVENVDDPGLLACVGVANALTVSSDETVLRCSCFRTAADNGIDLGVVGQASLLLVDSRERREVGVQPHLLDGAIVNSDEVTPALFEERGGGRIHSGDQGHGSYANHTHSHRHGYYTDFNDNGGHFYGVQGSIPGGSS